MPDRSPRYCVALPMMPSHHYLELAPVIESCGYHSIAVPDSVFYPREVSGEYPFSSDGERFWTADTPFIDPFVAIAAMSALTTRVEFMTNVLKVSLRHPLLVAKQVASLASLSQDRLLLGLGLSWIPEEFEWLGQSMKTRGARTDETMEILRATVCGDWARHEGSHYRFDELMIRPAASRQVPILIGGHSTAALTRAAVRGDGWISAVLSTAEIRDMVIELDQLRERHGRTNEFRVVAIANDVYDKSSAQTLSESGVTDIMVCPWYFYPGDPASLDHQRESLQRFAESVFN